MYVVALGASTFLSFGLGYLVGAPHQWTMSGDIWVTTSSAQYVANGGLAAVYSVNPWFTALPGFLVLYAPVAALGEHLGLVTGYPIALARPSMWLLTGPFFFLLGSTAVLAVDYLGWTLGVTKIRRRWLAAAVALLVVSPIATVAGHPEDLLALTLACVSLAFVVQGRTNRAAWLLCAAILVQTWALLLIPILIAASPQGRRIGGLIRSAAVPAVAGLALLICDFKDASLDLLRQPMPTDGQRLPWYYLAGHVSVRDGARSVIMLVGSESRSLAVLSALALAWAIRNNPSPRNVMLAASLALFARGFFEVEIWPYYLAPAAVLLALTAAVGTPGQTKRLATAWCAALLLYGCAPLSYLKFSYNAFLAIGILAATATLIVRASAPDMFEARSAPRREYVPTRTSLHVAEVLLTPAGTGVSTTR